MDYDEKTKKKGKLAEKERAQEAGYPKFFNGAFFFLGVTSLMAFNSIITPYDFFARFFPSVILSAASLTYNACNMAVTVLMLFLSNKMKLYPRIIAPLIIWVCSLIIIPVSQFIFPDVNNSVHMNLKLGITLLACASSGLANGFFFPSLMYIAGSIPNSNGACIAQVCSGQGLSGIIPEALVIIIKGLVQAFSTMPTTGGTDQEVMYSTLSFFAIGCVIVLVAIGLWVKITRKYPQYIKLDTPLTTAKKSKQDIEAKSLVEEQAGREQSAENGEGSSSNVGEGAEIEVAKVQSVQAEDESIGNNEKLSTSVIHDESSTPIATTTQKGDMTYGETFKLLIEPSISVWSVFLITLTIFPGLYTKVPCLYTIRTQNQMDPTGWWGVLIMTIFMVGDQIGRSLMTVKAILSKMTIHIACALSWSRLVFYILFILMILPAPKKVYDTENPEIQLGWKTPYISTDIGAMIIMLLFAISNGIAGTANMSVWGQKIKNPTSNNIQKGANVMTFMLNLGLFCGAFLSLGIDAALASI